MSARRGRSALSGRAWRCAVEASVIKETGTTALMVTHDPRIVDVADRLLQMEDGCLLNAVQ